MQLPVPTAETRPHGGALSLRVHVSKWGSKYILFGTWTLRSIVAGGVETVALVKNSLGKHPDVVFGDVALSKNQVRKIHGEDQSPGHFGNDSGGGDTGARPRLHKIPDMYIESVSVMSMACTTCHGLEAGTEV